MRSAGFIGGGRVARILVSGWKRAGALPARVFAHDPNDGAIDALRAAAPAVERASLERAASADVVFLALHPPAIAPVLSPLGAALLPGSTVVSLAPKVTLRVTALDCILNWVVWNAVW